MGLTRFRVQGLGVWVRGGGGVGVYRVQDNLRGSGYRVCVLGLSLKAYRVSIYL